MWRRSRSTTFSFFLKIFSYFDFFSSFFKLLDDIVLIVVLFYFKLQLSESILRRMLWSWNGKSSCDAWHRRVSHRRTSPGWEMACLSNRRKKAAISSLAANDTCSSSKPVWATIPACRRMWPASCSVTRQFSPFSVSKRKTNNNSKRRNRNECQIESRLGCVQWNIHNAECV